MATLSKIIGAIVLVVAFVCILALIISIPVWLLWNWLVPIIFPGDFIAHQITWLQALGIMLLTGFLFKSSSVSSKSS